MQKIYTVIMYRWDNRNNHSYLLGVFSNRELATKAAIDEIRDRGGKYYPEISWAGLNKTWYKNILRDVEWWPLTEWQEIGKLLKCLWRRKKMDITIPYYRFIIKLKKIIKQLIGRKSKTR